MCKVRSLSFICVSKSELYPNHPRYFETDAALQSHWKSKVHKRRCKALKEPAYTIEESERAAGLGRENKRPSNPTDDMITTT